MEEIITTLMIEAKRLNAIEVAVRHIVSKGMITITDHHDIEAWHKLREALEIK